MVYLIPKAKLPNLEYVPIECESDVPLMGMTKNGPIIFFTTRAEVVFVPWKDIVAYAMTAPRQKFEEEQEEKKPDVKAKVREVK